VSAIPSIVGGIGECETVETAAHLGAIYTPLPMPAIESTKKKHSDLIYDVGMCKGEDADFYLKKGFRVIGFEADPDLTERCRIRFSREIGEGRLTLVVGAIVERTDVNKSQSVKFYQNKNIPVCGTIRGDWAHRNELLGAPSDTIEVKTVDFESCLRQYGVPYYLKIDIEGSDTICLRALLNFTERPDYVSIESEKVTFAKLLEEFYLFKELGYTAFKAVQQHGISSQIEPAESREGVYANHAFPAGASGLFGEDLPGKWKNYDEILAEYKLIFRLYRLFGDSGKLNGYFFSNPLKRGLRKLLGRQIPGWYDTHARHSSHVSNIQ
jgi:FkbM family methyltransferase